MHLMWVCVEAHLSSARSSAAAEKLTRDSGIERIARDSLRNQGVNGTAHGRFLYKLSATSLPDIGEIGAEGGEEATRMTSLSRGSKALLWARSTKFDGETKYVLVASPDSMHDRRATQISSIRRETELDFHPLGLEATQQQVAKVRTVLTWHCATAYALACGGCLLARALLWMSCKTLSAAAAARCTWHGTAMAIGCVRCQHFVLEDFALAGSVIQMCFNVSAQADLQVPNR